MRKGQKKVVAEGRNGGSSRLRCWTDSAKVIGTVALLSTVVGYRVVLFVLSERGRARIKIRVVMQAMRGRPNRGPGRSQRTVQIGHEELSWNDLIFWITYQAELD